VNIHIKLAIEALEKQMKAINLDANLYEQKIVDTPHARNCFNKRQNLRAAVQWLKSNSLPPDPPSTTKSIVLDMPVEKSY
jgi:hypothetical protein